MPGPCSAPNGDITLVYITGADRVKAVQDTMRARLKDAHAPERLPGDVFMERRAQQSTGKTHKKRKEGS